MARVDLYFKVVADVDPGEDPKRLAAEVCRMVQKIYGIRKAELSNLVRQSDD